MRTGSSQADLVFAIHFNPQGSDEDFQRLIRWLQSVVGSADVDSGNVRIGFYVDDQYMPFQLNSYVTCWVSLLLSLLLLLLLFLVAFM